MNLDRRVHIAVEYEPSAMTDPNGNRIAGPALKRMSGGGLFLVAELDAASGPILTLLLAGILIEQHRPPAQHSRSNSH